MEDKLHCDICRRPHSDQDLPFLCAVDARNRLYEGRLQNAVSLMENEALERQVNATLPPSAPRAVMLDGWRSAEAAALDTTNRIIAQADRLKVEVDAARKEIEGRKESIGRRRSDLASASNGVLARRSRQLDEAERAILMTRYKWNRCAAAMAATRAFLCEEAARLYGLRQVKKGNSKRYEIGGVDIFELPALNNMTPEVVSTSLAHVAHILMLASHYLAIRLPAEITLPHRDYPRPTIFSVASSYRHGEVPFPGSALPAQMSVDARAGDGAGERAPRPRPLFIDKPLPTLAKEDPATYALFLEGVVLLSYNIAWACCTQGVSFGDRNSYEDVCNMGQNLWRLLIGDRLHRKSVEPTFPTSINPADNTPRDDAVDDLDKPQIGRWSHGTMHTFLGSADGTEFSRSFKLLSPTKLVDRLKKRLSSEAPMLEWEKIDGDEVRAADREFDDGVLVKGHRRGSSSRRSLGGESMMVTRGGGDAGPSASEDGNRASGTSGWTKLKHRQN